MSDNKNKNPVIGLAFLIAATAGGYLGGNALKPYYDTAVDYVKTDTLQQESERSTKITYARTEKLSAEAKKLKQQCDEIGSQIDDILSDNGISSSFSYTYETPTPKPPEAFWHASAGTCKMSINDSSNDKYADIGQFYGEKDFESDSVQAGIIRNIMNVVPKAEINKVAEAAPQILEAFPKNPPRP